MELGGAGAPEVRPGDHACCVFGSDDEQSHLVGGFARRALARGDRVFYLADRSDESAVVSYLDEVGLDGRALVYAGAVQIAHSGQMGLEDGFDGERQLAVWDELVGRARTDGYKGLAIAGEMTWALSWKIGLDDVIAYEAASAPSFASGELSALCQYDRRFFASDTLEHAHHAHPFAVAVHHGGYSVDYSRLRIDRSVAGSFAVGGEIDLANIDFLEAQLWEQLRAGDVEMDCSELTFVDVAGCRLLRQACDGAIGNGRLTIRNPPPVLARVMHLCDLADGAIA
jgi:anti-anti-sigma regulatory factor